MSRESTITLGRPARPLLTFAPYPALLAGTLAALVLTVRQGWSTDRVMGALAIATILVTFAVERLNPLRTEWQMTRDTLVHRDLPFIGLAVVVEQALQVAAQYVAIHLAPPGGSGLLGHLPLVAQAVFALVAADLLWYAYHRTAHTLGPLWRFHSVHHSPSQVYVLVHQVFHPLDLFVSRFVVTLLAMSFTGISPAAAFCAIAVVNLQQTVSHMNSDQRVGWLNYLLVGTETHRFHHSAVDRGNYSSALPLWDQVFGTFVHKPREVPAQLGLDDPAAYPDPREFHRTLAWPLLRSSDRPLT
ncbi:MAG: sterol desaturase family protein [Nocardioides sp.]